MSRAQLPMVAIIAAGALLFGGRQLKGPEVVEVSDLELRQLRAAFEERGQQAPAEALEAARRQLIRDEILYREALARGLDREDEVVRARLVHKMEVLLEASSVPPDPPDTLPPEEREPFRRAWREARERVLRDEFSRRYRLEIDPSAEWRGGPPAP